MKKVLVFLLTITMLLGIAACGGNTEGTETQAPEVETPAEEAEAPAEETEAPAEETEAPAEEAEAKDSYKVGLVIVAGDHGFTGESVKHAEMEADILMEKYDNLEVVVKSNGEAAGQISEIENLIAQGDIDAIMLWPTEGEALRSAAQTVVDAGIKLVVYDRLIEDFEGLEAQIMGDNFSIGEEMGTYLLDFYADYDTVDYLRFVGDSSTVTSQRSGGMDEVIDDRFNQVNETFVTDWSTEKAQEQMENWLNGKTNEEIEALDLIVTHDDEIVDGLMNALEAYTGSADLSGLKLITSVGGREQTLEKFESTSLETKFATWFFAPSFIRESVDLTAEHALGMEFSGTAEEVDGIYLIPTFSISNAGNAHYDFDAYRNSSEYEIRYSIGEF